MLKGDNVDFDVDWKIKRLYIGFKSIIYGQFLTWPTILKNQRAVHNLYFFSLHALLADCKQKRNKVKNELLQNTNT